VEPGAGLRSLLSPDGQHGRALSRERRTMAPDTLRAVDATRPLNRCSHGCSLRISIIIPRIAAPSSTQYQQLGIGLFVSRIAFGPAPSAALAILFTRLSGVSARE
jgi:hypothetical protein